jgi:hypothetical protein
MDGKIKQHVCIKFCVKLDKSATKTLEMLCEAFREHSSSQTVFFFNGIHVSRPVECQLKMMNVQGDHAPAKRQKMLKKFENSSTKTVTKQSMSSQTLLGSVMELAGGLYRKFEHAPHCRGVCSLTLGK